MCSLGLYCSLNWIPTVFPLDLYLIYGKGTTKTKIICVLAPNTIIVQGLLAFPLKHFLREVYNLALLLGFELKHCYFCPKANSFTKFHITDFAVVSNVWKGEGLSQWAFDALTRCLIAQQGCVRRLFLHFSLTSVRVYVFNVLKYFGLTWLIYVIHFHGFFPLKNCSTMMIFLVLFINFYYWL